MFQAGMPIQDVRNAKAAEVSKANGAGRTSQTEKVVANGASVQNYSEEQQRAIAAGNGISREAGPATPVKVAKKQPLFYNSILDNGQRLLVIIGKERRMIKLL